MFSNIESINILTALLRAHGIRRAVVCPGSRNAPIVHNLTQVMDCTPATDERSAGFLALGMAQATAESVVVCVTSGTALLNLAPAAAEALYQHVPLIIISADRPERWIDRQDGQTLPQADALGRFVKHSVQLPEHTAEAEAHNHCNLLINQTLRAATMGEPGPVHINVPLAEPLFSFTKRTLPHERTISVCPNKALPEEAEQVLQAFIAAKRPMLVVGQMLRSFKPDPPLVLLRRQYVTLFEPLSSFFAPPFDAAIPDESDSRLAPDFVLTMGGSIVSKRLKRFLRASAINELWEVNESAQMHDTFMHQTGLLVCDPLALLNRLFQLSHTQKKPESAFFTLWQKRLTTLAETINASKPPFSQMFAVKLFEQKVSPSSARHVHYANSSAVRLACLFSQSHVWCNRGVNGIEGSLSTAAGFSLATTDEVYCVIGDLSFFYDQNALWNERLRGNLRILLLNNNGGGIFRQLPGLDTTHKSFPYIAGQQRRTAEGICHQNDVAYLSAHNKSGYQAALDCFLAHKGARPIVLEVFTDAETDAEAIRQLNKQININIK